MCGERKPKVPGYSTQARTRIQNIYRYSTQPHGGAVPSRPTLRSPQLQARRLEPARGISGLDTITDTTIYVAFAFPLKGPIGSIAQCLSAARIYPCGLWLSGGSRERAIPASHVADCMHYVCLADLLYRIDTMVGHYLGHCYSAV